MKKFLETRKTVQNPNRNFAKPKRRLNQKCENWLGAITTPDRVSNPLGAKNRQFRKSAINLRRFQVIFLLDKIGPTQQNDSGEREFSILPGKMEKNKVAF